MPTPTIIKGEEYFNTVLYEGNGGGQRVGRFVPFTDNGTIANSCLFDDGSTPYLNKTTGTATSEKKFTFSAWVKLASGSLGSSQYNLYQSGNIASSSDCFILNFNNTKFQMTTTGSTDMNLITNRSFEDTSKFYHFVVAADTTQGTAADRIKIYVDGDEITSFGTSSYPAQDYAFDVSSQNALIGAYNTGSLAGYFDGYMAEVNYCDGQTLTPSTFGLTDTSTGRWIPKTLSGITYGTNGFRLKFQDSSALGDDTSGNGNDFSSTNLASTDQTIDSPSQNHMTMGGRTGGSITLSEGNLKLAVGTADTCGLSGMAIPSSGKWYWEITLDTSGGYDRIGVAPNTASLTSAPINTGIAWDRMNTSGGMRMLGSAVSGSWGSGFSNGDIIQFALDADNKMLYIGGNNTWRNSGVPTSGSTGTGAVAYGGTSLGNAILHPASGAGNSGSTNTHTYNFGQKSFSYTPPTGFLALQQDNLPETDKGISSMVWMKGRDATYNHALFDSSRTITNFLQPNLSNAEITNQLDTVQKMLKGGYAIEDFANGNTSGQSYVAWNWIANKGTTASNTDGSNTSTVQANTTAGFSIVEYTGTGSSGSVGHGLSSAPEWMLFKDKGNSTNWRVYHSSMGGITKYMLLNSTNAVATASMWGTPTTSAFIIGGSGYEVNESGNNYIAYCWHGVEGFSKFGGYTGNGDSNGSFVYTGFKPSWIMFKCISSGSTGWGIRDTSRSSLNPLTADIQAQRSNAEVTSGSTIVDFVSNGFKCRGNSSAVNGSGETYIYMAFAEHPFIGDGVSPVTAR